MTNDPRRPGRGASSRRRGIGSDTRPSGEAPPGPVKETAGTAAGANRSGAGRPTSGGRTSGTGRRAVRRYDQPSFIERHRTPIVAVAGVLVVALIVAFAFTSSTAKAYSCSTEWQPSPTPTTAPGATPRIGYVQDDMGRSHVAVGTSVRYTLCPPASGNHYIGTNVGPIPAAVYGPDAGAVPEGWVHNLEHGGLVVLYKCPGNACSDAGQAAFKAFFSSFPASPVCNLPAGQIGPVIARFDDMAFPYAALVWGQVLPLQTFDTAQILAFFQQQGERSNPEQLCTAPTAAPSAGPSGSPGASGPPAASPAPTGSPVPSAVATPGAS